VTFLSRADGHRLLTLSETLGAAGGEVAAVPDPACGSEAVCGLRESGIVLVVDANGACGLYRIEGIAARLLLAPLMTPAAPSFGPASVMVPVTIDVVSLDADERAVRRYDGYRSDNVLVEGISTLAVDWTAAALGDGPFVGTGPLAYNAAQLAVREMRMTIELIESPAADTVQRVMLTWRSGGWP
jgi:hypothetical protein